MVSEYNKAAREMFGRHGSGTARMEGFQYDLLGSSNSGTSDPVPDSGAAGLRSGVDAGDNTLPSGTLAPFDIIVIGMALHHVADAGRLMQRFAELLKPGGVCIVLDMVPRSTKLGEDEDDEGSDLREGLEQGEESGVLDTIAKHGFTEAEMRNLYKGAGMAKFDYVVFEQEFRFTLFGRQCSSRGFIARGERI
jgi:SAM-dependent methyltransferase